MNSPNDVRRCGALLSEDLIFTSRITGTAADLGHDMTVVRTADALVAAAASHKATCVIIDLEQPGLNVADLVRSLQASCSPVPRVVAYGSHVDAAGLRAAREAGCDLVLPRSAFVEALPKDLTEWLMPRDW